MKIFWWQLGLHFEPETPEENKALCLLFDSARVTSIAGPISGNGPSVPSQEIKKHLPVNEEISASGCRSSVEQFTD